MKIKVTKTYTPGNSPKLNVYTGDHEDKINYAFNGLHLRSRRLTNTTAENNCSGVLEIIEKEDLTVKVTLVPLHFGMTAEEFANALQFRIRAVNQAFVDLQPCDKVETATVYV